MTDTRKISLCVTTYNRYLFTKKCFEQILNDSRVGEIIISDDFSTDGSYEKLCHHYAKEHKVKLYRNSSNIDCQFNKHRAVQLATLEWVALLDSDNEFGKEYLDAIFDIKEWNPAWLYQPSFAKPNFDFREFDGEIIDSHNLSKVIDKKFLLTMLNAQNYFFGRFEYLSIWDKMEKVDAHTADSLWFNYNWLKNNGWIYVVPNMHYEHVIHNGSHYQLNVSKTGNFALEVENKLRALK